LTEAAKKLGISTWMFSDWERRYPRFKAAALGVRKNSEEGAIGRTQRLLKKSEAL